MPPSIPKLDLKWISLVTLVIQTAAIVLVMRYSRALPGIPYLASTAVVMGETVKLLLSLLFYAWIEFKADRLCLRNLYNDVFGNASDWKMMTVPAILYFVQNNLQYHAITIMDAATFHVTNQLKILTTAFFAVLILKQSLSLIKWTSLIILTAGVIIVQISNLDLSNASGDSPILGFLYVLVACFLSGLAGIWFEKVLKGSNASIFTRNIQLSIFSILPGLIFGVYMVDHEEVIVRGFFGGYNAWTWAAILIQAVGGLVVAMVIKYADNILKGFAAAIAMIVSCIASTLFFDFKMTANFAMGAFMVLLATIMYGTPDQELFLFLGLKKDEKKEDLEAILLQNQSCD